jgi:hypothetical protein
MAKAGGFIAQAVYRLPDAQLKEEIGRMDTVLGALKVCAPNTAIAGFSAGRKSVLPQALPHARIQPGRGGSGARHVPAAGLLEAAGDPGIKGPKGGLRITYENAKRHFDNASFTTVVSKAWVGTTPTQSQVLQDIIRETLKTGKAIAIAITPQKTVEHQG